MFVRKILTLFRAYEARQTVIDAHAQLLKTCELKPPAAA
jgi:hypothetical protein